MADEPSNQHPSDPKGPSRNIEPATQERHGLVDAVYEVALDPARYDELVAQWHRELTSVDPAAVSLAQPPLADHFQRATTILERVHRDDWMTPPEPGSSSTQSVAMPELVLSKSGKVLHANYGATALLSARTGAHLDSTDLTQTARTAILDLCATLGIAGGRATPAKSTADPMVLRITRLGDDRPLVVLALRDSFDSKPALLLRCAEIVWPETLGPLLAQAFGLTIAECEIVQALVAGQNTGDIATDRGTSKETVRTQIRQLLAKTGTHSQLELIRMAIGFSMMSQQAEARTTRTPTQLSGNTPIHDSGSGHGSGPDSSPTSDEQPRSSLHSIADGQTLEFVQYGPSDGDPILVFHDEVIGDGFVLPLMRLAPHRRWIVAVRPGYGGTSLANTPSADPENSAQTRNTYDALNQLAPGLNATPVLAHGNGMFFACRFALEHPDLCKSITGIAPSLPGKVATDGFSRYAAFMDGMSKRAPSMLRFAVQAGFAMYARIGARRFLERVYGDAQADREIIASDHAMADLEHGSRLTLAQGYRGFLCDEQALVEDWSEDLVATPVPIRIILGDQDQPARRARAEYLKDRSNNVELLSAGAAGFFAAFSAPERVIEALVRP